MKYLQITNDGEIDKQAFILLGASTKRGDSSKIGFFGSGLKYAIATLLREKVGLTIYSGMSEIKINTVKVKLREQSFDRISIAGHRTSLTTSMGADWKIWQAIREVYCNALDEVNPQIDTSLTPLPVKNKTIFYIEVTSEIQNILDNWNDYFSNERTDIVMQCKEMTVFSGKNKMTVYRKSIRCYDSSEESLYDYDINDIDINESRTLADPYLFKYTLGTYYGKYANRVMIQDLFDRTGSKTFEAKIEWSWTSRFNDLWLEVINERVLIPESLGGYFEKEVKAGGLQLPAELIARLKGCFGEKVTVAGKSSSCGGFYVVDTDKKQQYLIKESLDFFEEVGLTIPHPIKVAIFKDVEIMGQASKGDILLSVSVFEKGRKYIASTILEECMHLESGLGDETRGFQNFIINKILTILENKNGIFL